jgi:hypothetical protein
MSASRQRPLLVAIAALLAGCSSIPEGGDAAADPRVQTIAVSGEPRFGGLAVAPITTLTLAPDEASKGWKPEEAAVLDPGGVRRSVASALDASRRWDRVRLGEENSVVDAWQHRDAFVAAVAIDDVRTRFEGHNGWWIPNVINFVCNVIPAWWVATEEYSLGFVAHLTLLSAESGAQLHRADIPITVTGTFDDFDRGWQFFGPIHSSLDADGWRGIATKLFPAAERELSVVVARDLDGALRAISEKEALRTAQRKTLVLAVGVTHYQDPRALPPVSFANDDARRVASSLEALGYRPEHVVTLVDGAATIAAVRSSVVDHLGRAHDDDGVVFYFAGYGGRRHDGAPALLLGDATPGGDVGWLELRELASLLGGLHGRKVVILDAGFGGGGRSVMGTAPPPPGASDLAALDKAGLAAIVAGGPDEPVLAPEHLGSGLLTYHLVHALAGAHVARPAVLTLEALFVTLQKDVSASAELLGVRQVPRAVGLERGFPISLGAGPGAVDR